ncbi:MAG: hydrogenase iron-sulfur subunit, partial [Chloroflexi bacterium]
MRWMEKWWARGERLVNQLTSTAFNPFYHLGTLAIFLLIVLAVTGLYLTLFYRPGADRAFQSVAGMSTSWLGSFMRTTHRFASDALLLVVLLHAGKMLLGDRFWGSRWLAWVSGLGLLLLIWVIGVMGYWLVWDHQAQWLTEYLIGLLKGPIALAFMRPALASRTFSFFVIVLFLHIFLSVLIALGVWIHELRLSRAKYWAPRWVMVEAGLALVILALWRPVSVGFPADFGRLLGQVTVDGLYLGFLPLIERVGNMAFWGASGLLFVLLAVLPWAARGQHLGPAVITNPLCSGCALCFSECPFEAIEMQPRADGDPRFEHQAVINANLCTGCGLCVGTCSTAGAELASLPTGLVREQLEGMLARAQTSGVSPVVVFTCQRHVALGTLSVVADTQSESTAGLFDSEPWRSLPMTPAWSTVPSSGGNPHPKMAGVITLPVPCVGMVQPEWVRQSLAGGAQAAVIVSCPSDDCTFREGPQQLAQRLGRHRSMLRRAHVHWLEAAPGDGRAVAALIRNMESGRWRMDANASEEGNGEGGLRHGLRSPSSAFRAAWRSVIPGLALLVVTFGLTLAAFRPATVTSEPAGAIR